jgi:DNA-binding MarR family transcriptional regulator
MLDMKSRRKPSLDGPKPTQPATDILNDSVSDLLWSTLSMGHYIAQINAVWASHLNMSFHHWMIIRAIRTLDVGGGVAVNGVAKQLYADASFVATQTKKMEAAGLVRRSVSPDDARVVLLSLTDKGNEKIAVFAEHRLKAKEALLDGSNVAAVQAQNAATLKMRDKLFRISKRMRAEIDDYP